MSLEGVVQNGVIVPQGDCSLPDGTKVRIIPSDTAQGSPQSGSSPDRTRIAENLIESIREGKGIDPVPLGYDFLEALNSNRGPSERPLFSREQEGTSW